MTIEGVSSAGRAEVVGPTIEGMPRSKAALLGTIFGWVALTLRYGGPLQNRAQRLNAVVAARLQEGMWGATMTEGRGVQGKPRRIKQKGWLGGVCAGFGYWLGSRRARSIDLDGLGPGVRRGRDSLHSSLDLHARVGRCTRRI